MEENTVMFDDGFPPAGKPVAEQLMNLVQMEGGVVPTAVRSDHKVHYIEALRDSQEAGTSGPFLDFMTDELIDALSQTIGEYVRDSERDVPWSGNDESTASVTPQVTPKSPPQVRRLLSTLSNNELSAGELRSLLGLSDAKSFRLLYLRKAIDAGLVEMTVPDKPRSRNQRYRLTELGARVNEGFGQKGQAPMATDGQKGQAQMAKENKPF